MTHPETAPTVKQMRDAVPPQWYGNHDACDWLGPLRLTIDEAQADVDAHECGVTS